MYNIFLIEDDGSKTFYANIPATTPEAIIRSTVKEISDKENCSVFVRYITASGKIVEWDHHTHQ